jgi:photosystem II stability/assembly factor-like uncharacterized protein
MKKIFLLSIFLSFLFTANAQTWFEMIHKPGANLNKVRAVFSQSIHALDTDLKKEKEEGEEENGSDVFYRWEYRWRLLADAQGNLPDLQQQFINAQRFNQSARNARTMAASWQSLGPFSSAGGYAGLGRVNLVVFHPSNPNIFYAGTDGGGLWKTSDGGSSYTSLTDNISSFPVAAIAVDPVNTNTVYLGTSNSYSANPTVMYKSTDGGNNWVAISTPGLQSVDNIIVNPGNPAEIIISGNGLLILKSKDGGNTWVQKLNAPIEQVKQKPGDFNTLYAAGNAGTTLRLFRSADAGETWTEVQTIPNGGQRPRIAITPADPTIVEVATCNANWGMGSIFKSANSGQAYTKYYDAGTAINFVSYDANPAPADQSGIGWHCFSFCISPVNPAIKFIAAVNCWGTTDDGVTWKPKSLWSGNSFFPTVAVVHADNHFLGYNPANPGILFRSNDGGVQGSADNGTTWQDRTNGMAISQIYVSSPPPPTFTVAESYVMNGLQDNGTKRLTVSTGAWTDVFGGDGMTNAIDYADPSVCYFTGQNGLIYRNDFTVISGNIPGGVPAAGFYTVFTMNPRKSETLIGAYQDLYRTYDKGQSWTKITNNLFNGNMINGMADCAADTNTMIAYTYSALLISNNGGLGWRNILSTIPVSNPSLVEAQIHPGDPGKIYAILNNGTGNYLWYTNNGGTSWKNISYNLPAINYTSVAVINGTRDNLYIGGTYGVYYKDSTQTTWTSYSTALPHCQVNKLSVDYVNNVLMASTYGRGLWRTALQNNPSFSRGGSVQVLNALPVKPADIVNMKFKFNRPYFNRQNQFTVQLSDAAGSFASPVNLGTISPSYNNEKIVQLTMPAGLQCSNKYILRVIASAPADTTSYATTNIVIVPPAQLSVPNNGLYCSGGSIVLQANTGAGLSYQWYRDGSLISGAGLASYQATVPGVYTVKVSAGGSCDSISQGITVQEQAAPVKPVIAVSKNIICSNDSSLLSVSVVNGVSYQWYFSGSAIAGANTVSYTARSGGVYTVKATASAGCETISDPIGIIVNTAPAIASVTASGPASFCAGDSVTLNSSITSGVQWIRDGADINAANGGSYVASSAGAYSVRVTSGNGCSSVSSQLSVTVNSVPSKPVITRTGAGLVSDNTTGNQWYLNGSPIAGAILQTFSPVVAGTYTVKVTVNGCESLFSESYDFLITGINNLNSDEYIKLTPNPVKKQLSLNYKLRNITMLNLLVYDNAGRLVFKRPAFQSGELLDFGFLQPGVYWLQLESKDNTKHYIYRFVKAG